MARYLLCLGNKGDSRWPYVVLRAVRAYRLQWAYVDVAIIESRAHTLVPVARGAHIRSRFKVSIRSYVLGDRCQQ